MTYTKVFKNFLAAAWDHLKLPEPTPLQYEIADQLQYGPDRQYISGFRGIGKSWITSAYSLWRLDCDINRKILCTSASQSRSDNISTFMLQLLRTWPLIQYMMPDTNVGLRISKVAFDVRGCEPAHAPSVSSMGITGMLTGSRATDIIADDVESAANSDTQVKRALLSERTKEFESIISPGGRIAFLGTPQTEETTYNFLPERGYTRMVWPARYPSDAQRESYGKALSPSIARAVADDSSIIGKPTEPTRFGQEILEQKEATYGRSGFELQFMLNPLLEDELRYPLKLSDLIVFDLDTDVAPFDRAQWTTNRQQAILDLPTVGMRSDRYHWPLDTFGTPHPYDLAVLAVDPSGRGTDETAYCVLKTSGGYVFLLEQGGFTGGYTDDALQGLTDVGKFHKCNVALVESNFGDGMFTRLWAPFLRKTHPMSVEEIRHSTVKELRIIESLEPVMNRHRLVVNRSCVLKDHEDKPGLSTVDRIWKRLFYQLTRVTKTKGCLRHDDRIEVLAMGVRFLHDQLALSPEESQQDREQEAVRAEIGKLRDSAGLPATASHPLINLYPHEESCFT